MNIKQAKKFIQKNAGKMSDMEIGEKVGMSHHAVKHTRLAMGIKKAPPPKVVEQKKEVTVDDHIAGRHEKSKARETQKLLDSAILEVETLRKKLDVALELRANPKVFSIAKFSGKGHGEATAIALASDWHIEEEVRPETVSAMNFYNLEESKRRAEKFFSTLVYLVELEKKNTKINHLVLGLLGDFISGDIHPDIDKSALLQSSHAIVRCQEYIISGITHILKNSKLNITAICHTGNHGRKDKEQMIANEAGNSLEYLMYHMLKNYFRDEPRVNFIIPEGYHSYLDVYGTTLRFHHGHNFRYNGGVGGPSISINKKIAQWNKTRDARNAPFFEAIRSKIQEFNIARPADIDCFGHFHQFLDGGNFIMNGSMIGYNPYAISIGASYEPPKQALFFVHSKYGHYDTRRILFM